MCDFLAGMNQFGPPPPTNLFERPLQTPAQLQAIDLLAMLPDEPPKEKPENDADLYDLDPDEEERLAAAASSESACNALANLKGVCAVRLDSY